MVTVEKLSMAAELLQGLKDRSYDTCVSNLTKTHCVNLGKFNHDRLPEGTWIMNKRFLSSTNHVVPSALFDLFGEFSSQTGSVVHDNMVGWAFDNFRLLESVCKIALQQRKVSLRTWINKMSKENKCGDEITLYILSRMYRKNVFVYTQMFWWTSLLYTWPVKERDLMKQCEIVLVYFKPGVFGELHKIRPPAATITSMDTPSLPSPPHVTPENVSCKIQEAENSMTTKPVITGDAADPRDVSTGSTESVVKANLNDALLPTPSSSLETEQSESATSAPALPNINIFLTQCCSIPLIRCDYESALRAANTFQKDSLLTTDTINNPP